MIEGTYAEIRQERHIWARNMHIGKQQPTSYTNTDMPALTVVMSLSFCLSYEHIFVWIHVATAVAAVTVVAVHFT